MTDSFQAHKDVMQFLSQTRAMRSALVNRPFFAVCAVFVGVLSTLLSRNPAFFQILLELVSSSGFSFLRLPLLARHFDFCDF